VTVRRTGKHNPKWRDAVALGRARKRAARPKRDILAIKQGIANLRMRYCQEVSFWNPLHTGKHGDWDGGLQWVDVVVWSKKAVPIILDDPTKRTKPYEKDYLSNKLAGLKARGLIPLILPAHRSSQEYQILIFRHLKKFNT
jgi:hypothetical protein